MKISAVLMIKNEELRLPVTLSSLINNDNKPVIDSMIVYDTGSTDNTINILKEWVKKYSIPLYLKLGEFVDFSTSRNVLLDFADTIETDILLLLDSNDELYNNKLLKLIANKLLENDKLAFAIPNVLKYLHDRIEKFFKIKLLKNKCGLRYICRSHEVIKYYDYIRIDSDFYIYQNRIIDDKKSSKRWFRDIEFLQQDINDNPNYPRSYYYLGQTYECMAAYENDNNLKLEYLNNAMKYYLKRSTMNNECIEEVFLSYLKLGHNSYLLKRSLDTVILWYLKAFTILPRAEPLYFIAENYLKISPNLSYMFALRACDLSYPNDCELFVDQPIYEYYRYHVLSISAYNLTINTGEINPFINGIKACSKIINSKNVTDIDRKAWELYKDLFVKYKPYMTEEQIILINNLFV